MNVSLRPRDGEPAVYAFAPSPGGRDVCLICSPVEYDAIIARGWASLDGIRARIVHEACDRATGFLRLFLEQPWRPA